MTEPTPLVIPNPAGHQVVAPGQTVASDWGNHVWDQSVQCFASAADRDTQYPTPHAGAVCYTIDTGMIWVHRAGAWAPVSGITPGSNAMIGTIAPGRPVLRSTGWTGNSTDGNGLSTIALSPLGAVTCVLDVQVTPSWSQANNQNGWFPMIRLDLSSTSGVVMQVMKGEALPCPSIFVGYSYAIDYQL
jgi:hypothetical protein